jgi:hypothetical protein
MTQKLLRLAYLSEFFLAVIAIFTAWSEIGGQVSLDAMPWGWKFGLGLGLSAASVGYTAALVSGESLWNKQASQWLTAIIVLMLAIGVITWFYALQANASEGSDEQQDGTTTLFHGRPRPPIPLAFGRTCA